MDNEKCAYIGCNSEINTEDSPSFYICPSCNEVLYKCEHCEHYNRTLARYCRWCGELMLNKSDARKDYHLTISDITIGKEIVSYNIDDDDELFYAEAYGKIIIITRSGNFTIFNRDKTKLEKKLLLNKGEILVKNPIITDLFMYIITDQRILVGENYQLEISKNEQFPLHEIYKGTINGIIQLDKYICLDFKLGFVDEESKKKYYIKVFNSGCNSGCDDIINMLPFDDEKQFLAVYNNKVISYKIGNDEVQSCETYNFVRCINLKNGEQLKNAFCAKDNIYYISEGNFYRLIMDSKRKTLVETKVSDVNFYIHKLERYKYKNDNSLILLHNEGWVFFDCSYRKIREDRARRDMSISLDNTPKQVENYYLFVTRDDNVDLSKQTACIYRVDGKGKKTLDKVDKLIHAFQSFDMVYILFDIDGKTKLKGYSLVE